MTGPSQSLRLLLAIVGVIAALAIAAGPAAASSPAPGWMIDSFAQPTNFTPGDTSGDATYVVTATNVGAAATDASTVTIADTLPSGLTAQSIELYWSTLGKLNIGGFLCVPAAVACSIPGAFGNTAPGGTLQMIIHVAVAPSLSGLISNTAKVSGGNAPDASTTETNAASASDAAFGVEQIHALFLGVDGQPAFQAGAHPDQLITKLDLRNIIRLPPAVNTGELPTTVDDVKDTVVDLPLGFLGSAMAAPTCTQAQLTAHVENGAGGCPNATVVGHIKTNPALITTGIDGPIYNMPPEHGHAAEFGYVDIAGGMHALYASIAPTPHGYVLRTTAPDVPQVPLTDITVQFYGNPSAHDNAGTTPVAMFTNPTDCSAGPLVTTVHVDSWQHPGRKLADGSPDLSDQNWKSASDSSPPVTGCNKLKFQSSLQTRPDTTVADSPSGLDVDIKVPQSTDPDVLATPPLKKAVVTLPEGVSVNPGSADGLGACSPAQIALGSGTHPDCPDNSKIGTLELDTPLLAKTLQGSIYLASQNDNPFHTLMAAYLVVDDPDTAVVIKIPGRLDLDPRTGQITGTFDNNPQFPFSELKLHFKGGSRGVLATPESCGTFTTTSAFTPWSAPDSGPDSTPSDAFSFSSGCVSGFHPAFSAGTRNPQAGASSPFVLSFSRSDTDEELSGLSLKLPPGLLASVKGIPQCSDADANAGTCPAASQVGTVTSGAGPGPSPLFLPGKAYLTGPYKGGQFGLAVVVPAKAGPFDLGNVIVRQSLTIDPNDAHVTATSDPFPTILQGIPLRLRRIDVSLDRPGFMRNPTSCDPTQITGVLSSVAGTQAPVSSRFQVGGCGDLGFAPKLAMKLTDRTQTTPGKHPGLVADVTMPSGNANISKAVVTLPLSLALDPNNANGLCEYEDGLKNNCPASSIVGLASADTPLLDGKLSGPVYFVKGIRFDAQGKAHKTLPTLLIPLRGENGVELDLRASSEVNDENQLVTTFSNIPDAAISDFSLAIAGGQHGILAVTGNKTNICHANQTATQQFDGHNGKTGDAKVLMQTPCRTRVIAHKPGRSSVRLTVQGVGPGTVTVSGRGIKTTRKRVKNSTVTTLSAKLTKTGRRMRADHKKFHLRAKFTPAGSGARVRHSRVALRLRAARVARHRR